MRGGLTRKGLKKLEVEIDKQLAGRDVKAPDLDTPLKLLIDKYSYEVDYYNLFRNRLPYVNKYGTTTPPRLRIGLSLANFLANGVPVDHQTETVSNGQFPVTPQIMSSFITSFESFLGGHPSRQAITEVLTYDTAFNPSPR